MDHSVDFYPAERGITGVCAADFIQYSLTVLIGVIDELMKMAVWLVFAWNSHVCWFPLLSRLLQCVTVCVWLTAWWWWSVRLSECLLSMCVATCQLTVHSRHYQDNIRCYWTFVYSAVQMNQRLGQPNVVLYLKCKHIYINFTTPVEICFIFRTHKITLFTASCGHCYCRFIKVYELNEFPW